MDEATNPYYIPSLELTRLRHICTVVQLPQNVCPYRAWQRVVPKSCPPVSMLNKLSWLRHCIFMTGFIATEVPAKPHFHNKGLSLTALSVLPFWSHLAFRLSFQLNFSLSEKRSTRTMAVRHLQGLLVYQNKRKTRRRKKKKAQTRQLAELRATVYSQVTMSVSVEKL